MSKFIKSYAPKIEARQTGIKDYMGRTWFRILEDGKYRTRIYAMDATKAIQQYNFQKFQSK